MDNILTNKVNAVKAALADASIDCLKEKKINYGYQLVCGSGDTVTINIYHGKKGLSIVIQGKDTDLKKQVSALANGESGSVMPASLHSGGRTSENTILLHPEGISAWMGCDESGKGDVFGPLCAAACTITNDEQQELRKIGVCDSKMLDDKHIAKLATAIKILLKDRCIVRVMMPCEYNQLYDTMKMKHQNLNHLLGSVHAQNIRVLLSKHDCPCIIVDKFGKDEYVLAGLKDIVSTHQIIQVTKGERDIAVAAASILARQAFVQAMEELSRTYDMTFPKGAWLGIKTAIHEFSCRYGEEQLNHVGKLNFKNFDFLRG